MSPKQDGCKRPTPRYIIIKMPKVKDKDRIAKVLKEKHLDTSRGVPVNNNKIIGEKKIR